MSPTPSHPVRRALAGRFLASFAALLVASAIAVPAMAATPPATATHTAAATTTSTAATSAAATSAAARTWPVAPGTTVQPAAVDSPLYRPTVLVGIGGLRWTDVDPTATPTLWRMVGSGSAGSISIRAGGSATCPYDTWLTLSAGRRITNPLTNTTAPAALPTDTDCLPLPTIVNQDAGAAPAPATVSDWAALTTTATTQTRSGPGTLGDLLTGSGACSTAVGPGAAVMLANAQGTIARYAPSTSAVTVKQLTDCPVAVIDMGTISDAGTDRARTLTQLDNYLRKLRTELPARSRVLVAGIADTPPTQAGLQVVVEWPSPGQTPTWLVSDSTQRPGDATQRPGIVQLTDLTATVAEAGNAPTNDLDGKPLQEGAQRRMTTARTVENRIFLNALSTTISTLLPAILGILAIALLTVIGYPLWSRRATMRRRAAAVLTAPAASGMNDPLPPGPRARRIMTAVALLVASMPVSASLVTLGRWWVRPAPALTLAATLVAVMLVVALVTWGASRFLAPSPWRLGLCVSALTWVVLTVDGLTGTTLQQGSLLGPSPEYGARFYGFNNTTFSVYATSGLILAGCAVSQWVHGGRTNTTGKPLTGKRRPTARQVTLLICTVIAIITALVDGLPAFGADFGGILAIVPAFAVLAATTLGTRITVRRAATVMGAAIGTVIAVSVADWLTGPRSHLGLFAQRVAEGEGLGIVGRKIAGAWSTVANPAGAAALVVTVIITAMVIRPQRFRLTELATAYQQWPLLRPIVMATVTAAWIGTLANDSGIVVAITFAFVATAMLIATCIAHTLDPAPSRITPAPATARLATSPLASGRAPGTGLRRIPAILTVLAGGVLLAVFVVSLAIPGPSAAKAAGDVGHSETPVLKVGDQVVVIATQGLRWQDVTATQTPTLWRLLRNGDAAAGVTELAGACGSKGWLGLSSGREPAIYTTTDGVRSCTPWSVTATELGGATIDGWDALVQEQRRSPYKPVLGTLGAALDASGSCSTAVGAGAALALADKQGAVARYRDVPAALADPEDAFACPLTVVDAGAVPYHKDPEALFTSLATRDLTVPAPTADGPDRTAALAALDARIADITAAAPNTARVLLVDVGNPAPGAVWLGVAIFDTTGAMNPRWATTDSTHWEGLVRLLDLPTTLTDTRGVAEPANFAGSPYQYGSPRPDTSTTVSQLDSLMTRGNLARTLAGRLTLTPIYLGLAIIAVLVLLVPRWRNTRPRLAAGTLRVTNAVLLGLAALSPAVFLATAFSWWRFASPLPVLWLGLIISTATVAGFAALTARRPIWAAATVIASITFAVLVIDAFLGTPLHRGSPLGSAPTLGGRYYGFGNPTYSVFVVSALVVAAAAATALLRRGHRLWAVCAASFIGVVALVTDLWPTLGADVGGGLVLVPTFAVLVLGVAGARVTWKRMIIIGAVGVAVVGAIGVVDWMRPAAQRTHLGIFVQSVIDGTAWDTIARKGGYALRTLGGGLPAWVTLATLIALVAVLWRRTGLRASWLDALVAQWPLLRPMLWSMIVAAVAGGIANDYGVRVATIMLFTAIPLLGLLIVRNTPNPTSRQ